MFSFDWTSAVIGYVIGIMMYHSIAFLIIPENKK